MPRQLDAHHLERLHQRRRAGAARGLQALARVARSLRSFSGAVLAQPHRRGRLSRTDRTAHAHMKRNATRQVARHGPRSGGGGDGHAGDVLPAAADHARRGARHGAAPRAGAQAGLRPGARPVSALVAAPGPAEPGGGGARQRDPGADGGGEAVRDVFDGSHPVNALVFPSGAVVVGHGSCLGVVDVDALLDHRRVGVVRAA